MRVRESGWNLVKTNRNRSTFTRISLLPKFGYFNVSSDASLVRRALFWSKFLRYVDLGFFPASIIMSFTRWGVFSAAPLRQYTYHPCKVFVLGKKWRLQERSKFPQFSFSPQNAGTGNMHSVPWFLHTHGHKCDNQTIKGYFCRWKRPCAEGLQAP